MPLLNGKESQHTLHPRPLPVHTAAFLWKRSSFIFSLYPCASKVIGSLHPRTESVKTCVSYNKIAGWRSQGKYIRGSGEGSLSYLLKKLLPCFCVLAIK